MSGPDDPFTYNTIEVPTVVGLLHNILTQYPDNGQIIKELVQNAEDAGATHLEVVHVASPLTHPEAQQVVQRFLQGPAVCLYNDAVFTEEDWHGIRRLSDSIKKNNPLQVGQFGLGFKSVFHLTDYVTIISGQHVLFMDPSEPEDKMCRSLSLKKLSEVLPASACQRSVGRHLTLHHLTNGNFPATLFWFPLRQDPSRISDTIYTPAHVARLFESFAVEANICLTFLKSLEKITLSKAEGDRVTVSHCMKITSPALKEVRNKRQSFRKCLHQCKGSPASALTCYYEATLQTHVGEGRSQQQKMRILHLLPGKNDSEWIKWGGRNNSKHVPLVGVAVPVSPPAASEAKGHTFSFLPLPPDPSNQTSLPIQVNGAFILSQNRRQVKWRTSESSSQEPDVCWNEDMVIKVVSKAYLELLKQLLEEAKEGTISADTWYTFLPNLKATTGRWQHMAEEVWCNLLPLPIIASEVRGFLMAHEVLTSNNLGSLKPEVAEAVKKVLCDKKLPLATLPDHVQASISILGQQLSPVTPQLLRNTLRGMCSHLDGKLSRQHLLCYAAADKQYQDLCGLPLLPLQNQTWTSYSQDPVVYLCTEKEAKALLGLEGQVASIHVDTPVRKILQDVAQSGRTRLCKFQLQQHGPDLLFRSASYMQQCQPPEQQVQQWLVQVWGILQHESLNSVKHIPLLPTSHPPSAASLTCLSSPIVVQKKGCCLLKPQVEALALLGVVVVPPLPPDIRHIELQGYLYSSDHHGITQALNKVTSQINQTGTASWFNSQKTEEQRQALTSLIETHSIQPSLKNLLTKLNLFKAQDLYNFIKDVSLECVNTIAPELTAFPVSYPETLITPSLHQEQALALALGAHQLSKEALCVKALQSSYSDEDVSTLVSYILRDVNLVRSNTLLHELRNTRFVPNVVGSLCRPSELYDPEDNDCDILIGETQKPDDSFRGHYSLLRYLGLKKVQDMPQNDLVCLIKNQQNILLSEANKIRKSVGLLRAMNCRHDCTQVCQAVKGVAFVYGVLDKPCGYPSSLKWATPSGPLQPQGLKSFQYSGVLGSTMALVQCCDVPSVAAAFGWTETPAVELVIQHLKNITAAYQTAERGEYFDLVKQTYHQLSAALDSCAAGQLAALRAEPCVFTEYGFRTPDKVYIRSDIEDLQLLPHLHALPFELRENERLFQYLGCAVQQSPPLLLAVLQEVRVHHQGGAGISSGEVEHDRQLVMLVLDRLQHHLKELPGPLLVPVRTLDDTLELVEVEHSAYTEAATEWIDSSELGVKVVHECVGAKLASALGVAPLQSFLSVGGEAVMEWGQREPLTTRLHNLLQQYRDGVSLLKELVQNADDAEATTVHLLYDERQNKDARVLLLGKQMGECQGPALWAYNDAFFSEQDFLNLRELGAGTKLLQPSKIGKFGLGFCSVYNLTDVPSFVSGSSYVVFDPHMTHLSHCTNSPGLRFNFTDRRNSYMLRTLRGQFQPFTGVFGCDIQERGSFEGTLFRLPLRTTASKISDTCYSRRDMMQLLRMFGGVVGQLLLFTQHVASISVFHLRDTATTPSEMVELFCASRKPVPVSGLTLSATSGAQSLLKKAAALFSTQQQKFEWNGGLLEEKSTTEVSVQCSRGGTELCGLEEGKWSTTWVASWHSGSGSACRLAQSLGGKALPLAAVAVPVRKSSSGWQLQCLGDLPPGFYHEGHFHCFLPLPVKTLLHVQVNGVLEVASDRTNLLTQTEDDRRALSWNATLLGDAAVRAHLGLAEALRHLGLSTESPYHAIWPVVSPAAGALVSTITKGFYHALEQEGLELFRCSGGDWHPLAHCRFLDEDFLQVPQVGEIAFEFLETYLHSSSELRLVRLPKHVQDGFNKQVLSQHMVTQEVFFREYFIPHLSEGIISPDKRDQLTLHLLDSGHSCLELLQLLSCIPTQPLGTIRRPADLVNPKARIARMFSIDDERFPVDKFLNSIVRSTALDKLGMNSHSLPIDLVVERAKTVTDLDCPQCACYRVLELLHYITHIASDQDTLAVELKSVPFLPVMPKPESWCVAWHGDCLTRRESQCCPNHRSARVENLIFDCPTALCLSSFKPLVGSSHLLLQDNVKTSQEVLGKLGVTVCALNLPLHSVVDQLCVYSAASNNSINVNVNMYHAVYEHLEDFITHVKRGRVSTSNNIKKLGKLREKKILVTRHGFKEPKLFAMNSESDCAPDLFSVRTEGLDKYQHLMNIWGIKENYDYEVVMKVIQEKRETFGDNRLSEDEVSQVSKLLNVLFKVSQSDGPSVQVLHLPDTEGYLRPTQDLCLDDGAELSSGKFICLHQSISVSQNMCNWLGIKSKTRKRLQESSNRLHFGQKEPLTTRLKNILDEYPCDSGIMKELLQNADDAGATEVAFIKDFRCLPTKKLFDPQWAPIQGPALSVFNNRGFTEQDLRSIQDLGNSSKKEDPATTGQYGIGFNAVYHLTDAPSFLTRSPQVPQGETLCMFDPHCRYDPSASPESPGVQFINLNHLRNDHPDSFIGYLEEELSDEGTMFRLPLRTTTDSLIVPNKIMTEEEIESMLREFQSKMPQCLLFLKNVRKICIKEVQEGGRCKEEYCVEASVSKECHLPVLSRKHGDAHTVRDPCNVDMARTSYRMKINDSKERSSEWLVIQQQGVEKKDSLPDIVQNAFSNRTLNLLPHGGIAVLLQMNPHPLGVGSVSDVCSTSCYLPLPLSSGLPFSINGHFALNPSRRDLWKGAQDAKSLWNEWLMKELLVPAAVHAVEQFRTLIFPSEDKDYMTEQMYQNKVRVFHKVMPLAGNANSKEWNNFVRWFYEQVRDTKVQFFDSFIPETDLTPAASEYLKKPMMQPPARESRKGCLRWHGFHAHGHKFSVYFSITPVKSNISLPQISDVFRRLGMKLSSKEMYQRLTEADPEFECPLLTPEAGLAFLKSWDKDIQDRCIPEVGSKVADTPFLKPDNVLIVLDYIVEAKEFSSTSVDKLPLLLTNNYILRCFSIEDPVFLSSFCGLLPAFAREFTFSGLVIAVERNMDSFKDVVKEFTPADLVERLPHVRDASYCMAGAKIQCPDKDKYWLKSFWSFIVHFIEKNYKFNEQIDWVQSKEYILATLGDWAFYPVRERNQEFLISIKDSWQVLGHSSGDSVFHKLPVPFPSCRFTKEYVPLSENLYIPYKLHLPASLEDPVAVLRLLHFHRESINNFFQGSGQWGRGKVQTHEILDYLGKHCQRCTLSRNQICSLQIFEHSSGQLFNLLDRSLIVLAKSCLPLDSLASLCAEKKLLTVFKPTNDNVTNLYTYIEPNCIVEELDLYAKIILPNIRSLTEEQKIFYLRRLNKNLPEAEREEEWDESQQRVVAALKKCSFIEVDGILETADNFYDPSNQVFSVMDMANLPKAWSGHEWCRLLRLAGMIHKVTPDKFMDFASSLSPRDQHVKRKSEVLCWYLDRHYKDFELKMSEILDIEFLVPEKCDELGTILSHYETRSGLVALSKGVNPNLANIIWSTRSLLPRYATEDTSNLQKYFSDKIHMNTPPVEDILEHIMKLCSSMQKEPEKSPVVVRQVMESIYDYLSKSKDDALIALKEREVPIVHIPDHKAFVPSSCVVESLEEEILPYLYKGPTFYGKFFDTLKKFGMQESASSNTYAEVLKVVHGNSRQGYLHPGEAKSMKMALKGLIRFPYKLKDLSVSELYLPASDETLRSSTEMFVADNMGLLLAVKKTFQEPVFVGFKALRIKFEDCDFVNHLPQRLQPKFLSEACQESLILDGMEEVNSDLLDEVRELLQAQEFRTGVLRVIIHHRLNNSSELTQQEREEILALLARVTVHQVSKISTTITLHNKTVGQRIRSFFYRMDGEGDQQTLTLYISETFPHKSLPIHLQRAYNVMLHKWNVGKMLEFLPLFNCVGKPHDIHKYLDELDIKAYSAQSTTHCCLYRCDVGSYLEERFLPFLDNEFYNFLNGEIVCMKKYLCQDGRENPPDEDEDNDEDDIFVIVRVERLVEKHASCQMLDTYEVNTNNVQPCLVIVKAYQLFHFVRKENKDVVLAQASATQEEAVSEEEIFRKIRRQVKEIWGVVDERERRHLLRRLQFEWHPDKNPDRVELCTRVMQYIQSLVGRLERGEQIPDEEDPNEAPHTTPSETYSNCFRPPPRQYRNRNNRQERRPRSDLPEARRWHRQARSDLQAAERMAREAPSWAVFMCYQAAEKMLLAALYLQDMEKASRQNTDGPLNRSLIGIAQSLGSARVTQLANSIEDSAGGFLKPLYPTFNGCPCDHYSELDARQLLGQTRDLLNVLGERFT